MHCPGLPEMAPGPLTLVVRPCPVLSTHLRHSLYNPPMEALPCRHCLYSTPNPLLLGKHNAYYRNGSCTQKFGSRPRDAGNDEYHGTEAATEDISDMEYPFDPAASSSRDGDSPEQSEKPDQGTGLVVVDDEAHAECPFDTNMELVLLLDLLLDRLRVSRALQQDVLDFLFHPEYDMSQVLPKSCTAAGRRSVTFTNILLCPDLIHQRALCAPKKALTSECLLPHRCSSGQ